MPEAISLSLADLRRGDVLRADARGELRWHGHEKGRVAIPFVVCATTAGLLMTITSQGRSTPIEIELDPAAGTPAWFICPNPGCGRRVAKLFLPAGRNAVACATCHGISRVWTTRDPDWQESLNKTD